MSYTPKEWECGEIVTAEGLNNLEGGVQEALAKANVEIIEARADFNGSGYTCTGDTTASAIADLINAGKMVVAKISIYMGDDLTEIRFIPLTLGLMYGATIAYGSVTTLDNANYLTSFNLNIDAYGYTVQYNTKNLS